MPLTVKVLKEMLAMLRDDVVVVTQESEDFVHMSYATVDNGADILILSTHAPIGECKRTGEYVFPTRTADYDGVCPALDEDMYSVEFNPTKKDNREKPL